MGWGGEEKEQGIIPSSIVEWFKSFGRSIGGAREIPRKAAESLDPTDTLLLIGNIIACDVKAFDNLGLTEDWEKNLFARRLVIHLINQLDQDGTHDIRLNRIEEELSKNEDLSRTTHKRALDQAANCISLIIVTDLQTNSTILHLAADLRNYLEYPNLAARKTSFYKPSAEAEKTLQGVFKKYQVEICQIR